MKNIFSLLTLIALSQFLAAQSLQELSFGNTSTLDIVTWNIEHFPKNGQTTMNMVSEAIINLDADILAMQEIDDTVLFKQMLTTIPGYEGYYKSGYYGGLVYIYNSTEIQINSIYEIYTTYQYWSPFPRAPKVMDFNFKGENYILINNHFKCCGNGYLDLSNTDDEEYRRYLASNLIREYITNNFGNKKVIVVGDLNDEITDSPANNVFQTIINDPENFLFADMGIATGTTSNWSYPSWPSHLDHILITNELFPVFENTNSEIVTIKIDQYLPGGWSEYDQKMSDHRPIGIKLNPSLSSALNEVSPNKLTFSCAPNPFKNFTTFYFDAADQGSVIEIISTNGQKVKTIPLNAGQNTATWNIDGLPNGIYYAVLKTKDNTYVSKKIVLNR